MIFLTCALDTCRAACQASRSKGGKLMALPPDWKRTHSGFNAWCPEHVPASRRPKCYGDGRTVAQEDEGGCEVCGSPLVMSETGMCGACTFGEADAWDEAL